MLSIRLFINFIMMKFQLEHIYQLHCLNPRLFQPTLVVIALVGFELAWQNVINKAFYQFYNESSLVAAAQSAQLFFSDEGITKKQFLEQPFFV
jgi:hypothetical protein